MTAVPSHDPREAMADAAAQVADLVFDTLYRDAGAGDPPTPVLAAAPPEDLGPGDGGHCYALRLREGTRFSDGAPLDAAAVVRSLRDGPPLGPGEWVRADGARVVFTVPGPDPALADRLAAPFFGIARAAADGAGGLVGTGPYLVEPGGDPTSMRLTRNPHASLRPPADEFRFVAYTAAAGGLEALVSAIRAGDIDLSISLPKEEAAALDLDGLTTLIEPGLSTALLFLNTTHPILRDVEIRRAIALAIDPVELAAVAHATPKQHAAPVARSLLPPAMARGEPPARRHDPDAAARVIEAAGLVGQRLTVTLPWGPRMYLGDPWGAGEALAEQLAAIGLLADLIPTSSPAEAQEWALRGDYGMMLAGWSADTLDAADFLDALLDSRSIPGAARPFAVTCNIARIADAELDAALAAHRARPSAETQRSVDALVRDRVPIVPLCHGYTVLVHGDSVAHVPLSPTMLPDLRKLRRAP